MKAISVYENEMIKKITKIYDKNNKKSVNHC